MDFKKTVERAKSGDSAAWTELFESTQSAVYFTALKLTGNEDAAQDIAQEVYLSAMKHIGTLKDAEAFPGWIKRIAVNHSKNYLAANRPILFGEDEEDLIASTVPETDESILPEAAADRQETCRLVSKMVDSLPEKQRVAVILFYYDELSVGEIAQLLKVSENTVKSRLNYARAHIKKEVEAMEKDGTKLYSAGLPILALLLRNASKEYSIPEKTATAIKAGLASQCSALSAATASGAVTQTAAAPMATVAGGVAKKAKTGIVLKIVAAVVSLGVVVGGGAAILSNRSSDSDITVDFEEFEEKNSSKKKMTKSLQKTILKRTTQTKRLTLMTMKAPLTLTGMTTRTVAITTLNPTTQTSFMMTALPPIWFLL